YVTNPARTHRNPNLLIWQRSRWLIDHGAALYAHHSWAETAAARTRTAFPLIRDHALLARASDIHGADDRTSARLWQDALDDAVGSLPEALLMDPATAAECASADEARDRYRRSLTERLDAPRAFVGEAISAREKRMSEPVQRRQPRR